jgi:O-antigen/teichoic acid export membrane protein
MDRRYQDSAAPGLIASSAAAGSASSASAVRSGTGFLGNAGITLAGAGVGAALAFGNEILAAHFLGVATYGLYALALMLAKVGEIVAVFGLPLSVLHYLPVHLSRAERGHALGTILGAVLLPLAFGLSFALLLLFAGGWVATNIFRQPQAGPFVALLGMAIPLLALADLLGNVARGFGRALPYIVIRNITPALCYMSALILLLAWHGPPLGAAYSYIAGIVVGVLLGIGFVMRLVRQHIGLPRPVMQIRQLYRYAAPVALNSVVSLIMVWTDLFLLGVFTDASTVGVYRGCMQIVFVFDLVWNACSAATAPIYPVLLADGRHAQMQETYSAAVRFSTLLAVPIAMIIFSNSGDILGLLGPGFAKGALALVVLACGQFIKVVFGNASVVLIVGGRQGLEAANGAIGAGLNLMLNLLLVPRYGLMGAAIATATSLIALGVLRAIQLRRAMVLHTLDRSFLRVLAVPLALTILVWFASTLFGVAPGSGVLALILRVGVVSVVIGGGLWLFCLNQDDRAALVGLVIRRGATTAAGAT